MKIPYCLMMIFLFLCFKIEAMNLEDNQNFTPEEQQQLTTLKDGFIKIFEEKREKEKKIKSPFFLAHKLTIYGIAKELAFDELFKNSNYMDCQVTIEDKLIINKPFIKNSCIKNKNKQSVTFDDDKNKIYKYECEKLHYKQIPQSVSKEKRNIMHLLASNYHVLFKEKGSEVEKALKNEGFDRAFYSKELKIARIIQTLPDDIIQNMLQQKNAVGKLPSDYLYPRSESRELLARVINSIKKYDAIIDDTNVVWL